MQQIQIAKSKSGRIELPHDVAIHGGRILFGIEEDKSGIIAVILPLFSTQRCRNRGLQSAMERINKTPRLYQEGKCEALIKSAFAKIKGFDGSIDTRVTIENGNVVAYDQEAATLLWKMGLSISKDRHYVSIK
ncbi:MAG: hypothetical protein PHH16_03510 [Candidatus Gracilibacteria bacterium]|nr:hypothetical protein [Candidatus Gracilibacteria bacterium]